MADLDLQSASDQPAASGSVAARVGTNLPKYVLLAMAVLSIVVYVTVACLRMRYPYELEWMEGATVDHVRWILSGRPLYVEPSVEFVPNIYGPLYFYLGAVACKVMGVGFLPLRLISFAASLGCLWLIGRLVRRETGSWLWGFVSAGLFAATYHVTGAWLDIARVDSLGLLFMLAAIYVLRFRGGTAWHMAAGLLMGLSLLTKQSALFVAMPLVICTLITCKGWTRLVFGGTFMGFVLATTKAFDAATDGWYSYYVFHLPGRHEFSKIMGIGFWWHDIGMNLAVAMVATISAITIGAATRPWRDTVFYMLLATGMLGSSWLGRLHIGGMANALLPAAAVLAMGLSLGVVALHSAARGGAPGTAPASPRVDAIGRLVLAGLCLAGIWQFIVLGYLPNHLVPCSRDRRAGDEMIRKLASLDGRLLMPETGFLHTFTGRDTFHAHGSAVWDVLQSNDEVADRLREQFRRALRARKHDVLVLGEERNTATVTEEEARRMRVTSPLMMGTHVLDLFHDEIDANYRCVGKVFEEYELFWPAASCQVRPGRIYVRKDEAAATSPAGAWQPIQH
jgi:hypothetical protein